MSKSKEQSAETRPPETLSDKAPKPVKSVKLELLTHMIFEGEAKAPGDEITLPESEVKNWIDSKIAKQPSKAE